MGGFVFSKLLERYPNLGTELNMLRSELMEQVAGEATEMKVCCVQLEKCCGT